MLLDAPVLPTSETLCSKDVLLPKTAVLEPRPTLKRDSKLLLLHPDKCTLEGAKEAFQKVSSAFRCLSDARRK